MQTHIGEAARPRKDSTHLTAICRFLARSYVAECLTRAQQDQTSDQQLTPNENRH